MVTQKSITLAIVLAFGLTAAVAAQDRPLADRVATATFAGAATADWISPSPSSPQARPSISAGTGSCAAPSDGNIRACFGRDCMPPPASASGSWFIMNG